MIKNKNKKLLLFLAHCVAVFGMAFGILTFSQSDIVTAEITSDLAKWYSSSAEIEAGTIVAVDNAEANAVTVASENKSTTLLGVVVPAQQASIELEGGSEDGKVQVAIAGRAQVKVSKVNGPISRGDLIGLSAVDGVGAKALEGRPVVGVAESSFGQEGDDNSDETGVLSLIVSVGIAPSAATSDGATSTTWIRSIAGRDVSAMQLFFVFFIAAIGIISIVILTYSAVKSGVVATGRNPLARPAILRALSQTMIMVSLVAISCFSLMYFMLRL